MPPPRPPSARSHRPGSRRSQHRLALVAVSARNRQARALFAPLGPTYDRYARLLSFGQDPRWRRFLLSRIAAGPHDTVLDVATGTGAVAAQLVHETGCAVVGLDQSAEMLATARRRLAGAGLADRVRLVQGRAERLPFEDASFDALTFTYLLRYVDDPSATLHELARVVRPGGTVAALEFGVPPRQPWRALWELWVDFGLPGIGHALSPGWGEVGRFLGPSIRGFYREYPLERLARLWRRAGIDDVRWRLLSLGGGVVTWGQRA
ncbi:MAG: class I SAM-dependent methyltransferase [Thermoleophilia bacterium]|nr:class I SAM-dependent methyltransferase [Thermoleophilia bacterium]